MGRRTRANCEAYQYDGGTRGTRGIRGIRGIRGTRGTRGIRGTRAERSVPGTIVAGRIERSVPATLLAPGFAGQVQWPREPRRDDLSAALRDRRKILLAVHIFDPLVDAVTPPGFLPMENRPSKLGRGEYFIVQNDGIISGDDRQAIEVTGVKLLGYLPNNAYLVRASASAVSDISRLSHVRWIGGYGKAVHVRPHHGWGYLLLGTQWLWAVGSWDRRRFFPHTGNCG